MTDDEILKILGDAPIGVVADALVKLGLQGMAAGLWPLAAFRERRIAGPARTMRFLPARGVKGPKPLHYEIVDKLPAGSVLVIDGQGADYIFIGDNIARMAGNRGSVGIVVDGFVRDQSGLRQADVPIFARGPGVRLNQGAYELVDYDVPVSCGGVQIRPGDIVLGDEDGIVVVAQEMKQEVAATVLEVLPMEAELERAVIEDRPLAEIREIMARRTARKG
jgi:4-hydroxy-4-methyl-2-oxoglutarate aldolase